MEAEVLSAAAQGVPGRKRPNEFLFNWILINGRERCPKIPGHFCELMAFIVIGEKSKKDLRFHSADACCGRGVRSACESPPPPTRIQQGKRTWNIQFNVAPRSFLYSTSLLEFPLLPGFFTQFDGFYISGLVAATPELDVHLTLWWHQSIRPSSDDTTQRVGRLPTAIPFPAALPAGPKPGRHPGKWQRSVLKGLRPSRCCTRAIREPVWRVGPRGCWRCQSTCQDGVRHRHMPCHATAPFGTAAPHALHKSRLPGSPVPQSPPFRQLRSPCILHAHSRGLAGLHLSASRPVDTGRRSMRLPGSVVPPPTLA